MKRVFLSASIFLIVALWLAALPATVFGKGKKLPTPVPGKGRKLSAVSPSATRVLTVSCTDQAVGVGEQALAIALLATDDSNAFSMSLYVKPNSDSYTFRQLSGKVSAVPGGVVFRAPGWGSSSSDFFLHAHPRDVTAFPGLPSRYQCRITGDMRP